MPRELYLSLSDSTSIPRSHDYRLEGTVTSTGGERLTLDYRGQGTALELPFESVTRLEISQGGSSRGASFVKGGGVGLLAGAAFGAVVGFASGGDDSGILQISASEMAAIGAAAFGALGMIIGAVVGLATGGERWKEVSEPFRGLTVGILPRQQRGISLSLSQRF